MAVDEAILHHVLLDPKVGATLRWYRWQAPTLSLGYFQSFYNLPAELKELDCVRRLTGGGAILHHHELTYSLVVPAGQWPLGTAKQMVLGFHQCVAEVLSSAVPARLHPGSAPSKEEPFLCFLRRSQGDLVVGDDKILGSAQRNRQGALLQHGSILLQQSPHTPILSGLSDDSADTFALQSRITERIAHDWRLEIEKRPLSPNEEATARGFEISKYQNADWNQRR
jgi:lipoate-protein ligase A